MRPAMKKFLYKKSARFSIFLSPFQNGLGWFIRMAAIGLVYLVTTPKVLFYLHGPSSTDTYNKTEWWMSLEHCWTLKQ